MIRKLLYGVLLLLIILTPFIYSGTIYNGAISAKQLWFFGVTAITFLIFGVDFFLIRRRLFLSINLIDFSLLIFYMYFLFRAVNTPYTPILENIKFLNYTSLIILYFIIRWILSVATVPNRRLIRDRSRITTKISDISLTEVLIIFLVLTGLIQAIWGLLQLYGFAISFHPGFKITGTFFNPAPYALYLSAIFPLALGCFLKESDKEANELEIENLVNDNTVRRNESKRISWLKISNNPDNPLLFIIKLRYHISLLAVTAIILVLPATMNRASWIGFATGSAIIFSYRYHLPGRARLFLNTSGKRLVGFAVVCVFTIISGTGLYLLKKGSSEGRILIWEVTLGKIIEKPLFGYGVGRFEAEYNNWQSEYFRTHPEEMDGQKGMVAGNTKYCFNEYIEMTSELGLAGTLFFLGLIISVFSGIYKTLKSDPARDLTNNDIVTSAGKLTNDNRMTGGINKSDQQKTGINSIILLASSLAVILTCALFSYPFYSLPTTIIFFMLLAGITSKIYEKQLINKTTKIKITIIFRVTLLLTLCVISGFMLKKINILNRAYNTLNKVEMLFMTQYYDEACKGYSDVYGPLRFTNLYFQHYGIALSLAGEYQKSIEILELARMYTSDEILYTTLGDTYKSLKRYTEAEQAYKHAYYMVPHKLYPRYLLANLYRETGQKDQAIRTAKSILNQKIKVHSTTTEEIIKEMQDLITTLTIK